jgi:hypothetical protein
MLLIGADGVQSFDAKYPNNRAKDVCLLKVDINKFRRFFFDVINRLYDVVWL